MVLTSLTIGHNDQKKDRVRVSLHLAAVTIVGTDARYSLVMKAKRWIDALHLTSTAGQTGAVDTGCELIRVPA